MLTISFFEQACSNNVTGFETEANPQPQVRDPVKLPKSERENDTEEKRVEEAVVAPPSTDQDAGPIEGKPVRRRKKPQGKEDAAVASGAAYDATSPQDTAQGETTSLSRASRTTSLVSEQFDSESVHTASQSSPPSLQPPVKPKRVRKSKPKFSMLR